MSESERDRILELVSARLDGELTAEEEAELERALAESPELVREAEGLESTVAWLTEEGDRRVPGDHAEPGFAASVMERIGDGGSADEGPDAEPLGDRPRSRWRPARWLPLVTLAASILLAVVFVFESMRTPTETFEAGSMAKGDGLAESETVFDDELADFAESQQTAPSGSVLRKSESDSSWEKGTVAEAGGGSVAGREPGVARILEGNARSKVDAPTRDGMRSLGYASDQGDAARDDDEAGPGLDAGASLSVRERAARGRDGAVRAGAAASSAPTEATSESVVLEVRVARAEAPGSDLDWLASWEAELDDARWRSQYEARRGGEAEAERAAVPSIDGIPRSRQGATTDRSDRRASGRKVARSETQGLAKKSDAVTRQTPPASGSAESVSGSAESSGSAEAVSGPVVFDRDLTPAELAALERAFEARGIAFRRVVIEASVGPPADREAGRALAFEPPAQPSVPDPKTRSDGVRPEAAKDEASPGAPAKAAESLAPARGVRQPRDAERIRVTIRLAAEPSEPKRPPAGRDQRER